MDNSPAEGAAERRRDVVDGARPPSPANMPVRIGARCPHPRQAHAPKGWSVVETLRGSRAATVVVDGCYARRFTHLNRVAIAPTIAIVQRLQPLIERCSGTRRLAMERTRLACGAEIRIVADPVLGPYGQVRAVALWAGAVEEDLPPSPVVGIVEWDATVVVSASSAGRSLLLDDQPVEKLMLPEMLSCFDRFEERSEFLSLLSFDNPIDEWIGLGTRTFADGTLHRLHLAARGFGTATDRVVRAVVCDITDTERPVAPDMYSKALRNVSVQPGHALALIDLGGKFIHDWVAADNDPMSGWAHHRPLLHPEDQAVIVAICQEMADGTRTTASVCARVRFDPADDWIRLESRWTRIVTGDQPQVLAEIAIVPPIPPSITDRCPRCRGTSDQVA